MRTILLMVWANIKSKKLQSVALGVVFIAVSILFFLSIRLFDSVSYYEDLYLASKSSQSFIYADNEETKDIVVNFLENTDEILNVNILANYNNVIDANITQEDVSIPMPDTFFTEYSTNDYDQLKMIEGKSPSELLENEVIFSYGKSQLNGTTIGDTLIVNTEDGVRELIIAGIGVDLTYNFDTITLNRFWASKDTVESFENEDNSFSIHLNQ